MSLENRNILITRSKEQAQEFAQLIKKYGANPVFFPTIEIKEPESWNELDNLLNSLNNFDGVIFTSQNAIKYFFIRLNYQQISNSVLENKLTFVIGEKSKIEIEKHNLKCTAIPESYTAEELAHLIKKYNIKGKNFLFPRGNLSREIIIDNLRTFGAEVTPVVVYQTICPEPQNIDDVKQKLLRRTIDVVTFTSPSTANNFFKIISDQNIKASIKELTKIAVIGVTTAKALEKNGITPHIIAEPSTLEGLLESIKKYFEVN